MSIDRIEIRGIRGRGHHGVFAHERAHGQEFSVDVFLTVDTSPAGHSDDLADTVDYGVVAAEVHALLTGEPVDLLESLAERIATACLGHPGVREVEVAVHKPQAPVPVPFDDVVLRITRSRQGPERQAVLALGANLGDPAAALAGAARELAALPDTRLVATSGVYRTDPVGGPAQDDYLNAVVVVATRLTPAALLEAAQGIEASWQRTREVRWGPRTLDVDIIAMGEVVSDDPALTLPHPRAAQRAFVCVPWLEADPTAVLPGYGPVADLLPSLDTAGIHRTDRALLAGGDPA